jgi:site-specific DNA-methyltransferase (adenine-specific)
MKNYSILVGDCLDQLNNVRPDSVDLIYLDPPFFSQKKHVLMTKDGLNKFSFEDHWPGIAEYIHFIKIRLIELRKKLKPSGSLFLHCDSSASHYLRVALDEVFGADQFRSEIIWSYKRWSNSKKGLLNNHQTIYFYSKTQNFKFNCKREAYSVTTNVEQIVQLRVRDGRSKTIYKTDPKTKKPIIAESKNGVPMGDVWHIPFLNPKAKERVDYPTQKPVLLLERIIELVTDEGDLVLDPFVGSGTTGVAALLLKRKFIGIDKSFDAVNLTEKRLKNPVKSESQLLIKGQKAYDRQSDDIKIILESLNATPVRRNKGIDGLINIKNKIVPFKVVERVDQLDSAVALLKKATRKNNFTYKAIYLDFDLTKKMKVKIQEKVSVPIFQTQSELEKKINKIITTSSQFD